MAPLRRGGRKMYKKRRNVRRVSKALGLRNKYADSHSFKLMSNDTSIVNTAANQPKANGAVSIGPALVSASGQNRYWFGGVFSFALGNTLQVNQLNTLFDRYRINGIKVKVIPQFNVSETSGAGVLPVMRCVYDYDDQQIPTPGDVWSRRGLERRLDKPFTLYLKPKTLQLINAGGTTTANSPQPSNFLDMANTTVPHYGIKFAIKDWLANTTPNTMVLRFEVTYYVTCKEQIQIGRNINELDAFVPPEEVVEGEPCENQVV